MTWTLDNLGLIGDLALAHLRQSLLALLLGAALALPLGWLAWSRPRLRSVLVTGTGLLYTIPSLALLLILPIVVGFPATSEVNLVIALAIYVVAIMVRSVVDGLRSTRPSVTARPTSCVIDGWVIFTARASSVTVVGPFASSRASRATIEGEIAAVGMLARSERTSRSRNR